MEEIKNDNCIKRTKKAEEEYKNYSKTRLANVIKKKFDSTIIGSLKHIEDNLGVVWGHGLEYDQLTEDQKYYRGVWEELRKSLLDHGHSNKRAVQNELSQYSISWNRYVMNFKMKENC